MDNFTKLFGSVGIGTILLILIIAIAIYYLYNSLVKVEERYTSVVERFGKRNRSLNSGYHFILPFAEKVVETVPNIEQRVPFENLDVITSDNAILKVSGSLFFLIVDASKAIYQTDSKDLGNSLVATAAGIIRSELGKYDFDQVQTNRSELNKTVKTAMDKDLSNWGVVITRAEILQVDVDAETKKVMLQQLTAERTRRAAVTEAEGKKESVKLQADAALYKAEKTADAEFIKSEKAAEARRVTAEAEAYATEVMAKAFTKNGLEAARYHVALKQIETLTHVGSGDGKQTIVLPADFVNSFGNAFKMFNRDK